MNIEEIIEQTIRETYIEKYNHAVVLKIEKEYKFHPERKWRFDYAIPFLMVAIEIEGGLWVKGRHITPRGYLSDMEKYNSASILGWRVLRYAPNQTDELVRDLKIFLKGE